MNFFVFQTGLNFQTVIRKILFFAFCFWSQLLRYKPWRVSQDNAWDDEKPPNYGFDQKWQEFLDTTYAQSNVPDWFDKLQEVVKNQQDSSDENTIDLQSG